ncbi:MAG: hypothetical protein DRJ03_25410 [Chloroflexi bacterium]|nr:MAG: hypothetical protein DRI81_13825 [Chloroflexota bacterium]RLC78343.1 MAG: hypothetical protein DRJ03_25410 [Chloroflexota bacterium]HEY74534.1 carotenoid 1,2-hydratase [Thermoflexia bacterium]
MKTSQQQIRLTDEWAMTQLDPAEDGAHQLPGDKFFEWWYFDAHFDNGYHLVVALHPLLFNVSSRPAVIAVHLYGPGGWKAVEVAAFRPSETVSAVGRCDVRLGGSRAWDAGSHYSVRIEQGSIQAELEYQKEIEGVQTGTGGLFMDPTNERSFHWIIPLPRARVSGYLWIDDQRIAVSGVGYHDHNWGNLDLYQVVRRWSWGHVIADRHTMIFWELLGRGMVGSCVTGAILWQGPELLLNTDQVNLHPSKSRIDPEADVYCLDRIRAQFNDNPLVVQATLQNQQVLDRIDFAQPRSRREITRQVLERIYFLSERVPLIGQLVKRWVGYGTYHRLQAECKLKTATECHSGHVFYEIMDFGDLE